MSTRISALESTQNDIKMKLAEVMQTYQSNQEENTLVLKNLSSMVSIMMERIGGVQSERDPKLPPPQFNNSEMPTSEPILNSWAGSAGDTTRNPRSKVIGTEDPTLVANLNVEGVMGGGRSPQGESDVGASKVGASNTKESPGGGLVEGGGLGGGGNGAAETGEPTPSVAGDEKGGAELGEKGVESGSKIEGSGDGGSGNVDMPQPLSPGKRATPKRRRKNKHQSPSKVGGSASQEAHASDQVSSDNERIGTHFPVKLLIFNVHGTLLDCNLLSDPNPNTSIRTTTRSLTRRIVFRPWLTEFIDKCFKHFRVGFWGIKSTANMEDVVAEMMRKFNGQDSHKPVFCWSAKECEEDRDNIGVSKWKKPLSKVWGIWPEWNEGNTMIIDHMGALVDCNPVDNVIIPPAFYVQNMTKLADDHNYLRSHLWPLLKGLVNSVDVRQFRSVLPKSKQAIGDQSQSLHAGARTTRRSKMKLPATNLSAEPQMTGEGTCELLVHIAQCPLTYVPIKFTNGLCMLATCAEKSREGASHKDGEST